MGPKNFLGLVLVQFQFRGNLSLQLFLEMIYLTRCLLEKSRKSAPTILIQSALAYLRKSSPVRLLDSIIPNNRSGGVGNPITPRTHIQF
jgi:hypothetical protein